MMEFVYGLTFNRDKTFKKKVINLRFSTEYKKG